MSRIIQLGNAAGMRLALMETGAALLSLQVPVGDGHREVLLGCQVGDYTRQTAYLNALVGRFANRIGGARLRRGASQWLLSANQGPHCLHGGADGFDRRRWLAEQLSEERVRLRLVSPAGDQGFPGELTVTLDYWLADLSLCIDIEATSSAPTPVNLTSHGYFNLDGRRSDVRHHSLQVAAARYLATDEAGIPQVIAPVEGALDLRTARQLLPGWLSHPQLQQARGFDHCYLLDEACRSAALPAACLRAADGRLAMQVYTNQPGLQVYTANYLAGTPSRDGRPYAAQEGICLEAQQLPDSPNRPELGDPWLLPGERYRHSTRYQFIAS